jgi:hypothetical protein
VIGDLSRVKVKREAYHWIPGPNYE